MKLAKRKAPRFQRGTEFSSYMKDMGKIRDSHYLLVKLNAGSCVFLITQMELQIIEIKSKAGA